jgi:hypothetical protein
MTVRSTSGKKESTSIQRVAHVIRGKKSPTAPPRTPEIDPLRKKTNLIIKEYGKIFCNHGIHGIHGRILKVCQIKP